MALVNYGKKEIQFKIVYYGCGVCGKTTNLQVIHERVPAKAKGNLPSLATSQDRTLFFDFLPLQTTAIEGFVTKFQMYTVPGQVKYNSTRRLVLRNCLAPTPVTIGCRPSPRSSSPTRAPRPSRSASASRAT